MKYLGYQIHEAHRQSWGKRVCGMKYLQYQINHKFCDVLKYRKNRMEKEFVK